MSLSSIDVTRDKMLIKLDKENPPWTAITDLEFKICEILGIMPSVLLIIGIQQGCVEITFSIPKHISQQIFRKPLTKEQEQQFRAASILRLSCGDVHLIEVSDYNSHLVSSQGSSSDKIWGGSTMNEWAYSACQIPQDVFLEISSRLFQVIFDQKQMLVI